jgi:hypothetical protein
MKSLLAAFLLSVSLAVAAGEQSAPTTLVLKAEGGTIRLFKLACTNDMIVTNIQPQYLPHLRAAEGEFVYSDGRPNETHGGCWMLHEGQVVTVWDDGDTIAFPAELFKAESI